MKINELKVRVVIKENKNGVNEVLVKELEKITYKKVKGGRFVKNRHIERYVKGKEVEVKDEWSRDYRTKIEESNRMF